jgi:uncharacterized protein YciI
MEPTFAARAPAKPLRSVRRTRSALVAIAALLLLVPCAAAAQAPPAVSGLGKLYYMIVFRPGPNWIKGKPSTQQPLLPHGKYLQSLYDRHVLVFAGPFLDDAGGFAILDCPSEDEAKAILANEPATRAGVLISEIHPVRYAFDQAAGRSIWPPHVGGAP